MQDTNDRFRHIKRTGRRKRWSYDFYHSLLTISWRRFFLLFAGFFFIFNGVFGFFYWAQADSILGTDGSYWNAFLFSVQTFSTVGYGAFSPHTSWAHSIVVCESLLSVFVTAVLTGLVFAKFSRPTAKVIFSKNILIQNFDGQRILTLRIGNLRGNQIVEAQVRMVMLKTFVTAEGQTIRRQLDLKLVRDSSLFFALTWSIMHVIDENSPLYGLSIEDFRKQDIEIGVSVIGNDSTFSQTVHAGCIYSPEDIVFDRYFEDVLDLQNGEVTAIHYERFHSVKK